MQVFKTLLFRSHTRATNNRIGVAHHRLDSIPTTTASRRDTCCHFEFTRSDLSSATATRRCAVEAFCQKEGRRKWKTVVESSRFTASRANCTSCRETVSPAASEICCARSRPGSRGIGRRASPTRYLHTVGFVVLWFYINLAFIEEKKGKKNVKVPLN